MKLCLYSGGGCVALFGGQLEPAHGLAVVLRDTFAVGIHDPQVELRVGVALFGGESVPAYGLTVVLRDTFAVGIHDPQVDLRGCVALFSAGADVLSGLQQ